MLKPVLNKKRSSNIKDVNTSYEPHSNFVFALDMINSFLQEFHKKEVNPYY